MSDKSIDSSRNFSFDLTSTKFTDNIVETRQSVDYINPSGGGNFSRATLDRKPRSDPAVVEAFGLMRIPLSSGF
jgi:hypothetical protein